MDYQTALAELQEGNRRFVEGVAGRSGDTGKNARGGLVAGQSPMAALLSCADSRVVPEYVFDQGLGDLFVVRVAGNVASTAATGSLEFAATVLEVPLVVVLGHEDCGAVTLALEVGQPEGDLGTLIGEVQTGEHWPLGGSEALAAAVEHNAMAQANRLIERSAVIRHRCHRGDLLVVAAVYHLASGRVAWLGDVR